ncbi:MAG TPA: hypothetical protein VL024_08515, partial [Castellaniella sp.]|nr:hypothetical protein [Castellaniella sp.]
MAISFENSRISAVLLAGLLGLLVAPALAGSMGGSPSGLLGLSPQTFPVSTVPSDEPLDPDTVAAAQSASADTVIDYGLIDLPLLWPYGYEADQHEWASSSRLAGRDSPLPRLGSGSGFGQGRWVLGARNWRYAGSASFGLTLGNALAPAPALGQAVRLAGVRLAARPPASDWEYAVAAGALDDAGSALSSGQVAYGPTAYDVSTQYLLNPDVSLAAQIQGKDGLVALATGGEYSAGVLGTATLGLARSQHEQGGGWRYAAGYSLALPWQARLSWRGERRAAAYSDLALLQSDVAPCQCDDQLWELGLATNRWGRLSGLYERSTGADEGMGQRFGISQRLQLGQGLRIQLLADRQPAID